MAIQDTVKKLFGKVLKVGTPPEKEVLYKEVIKRKVPKESAETLFVNNIKQSFNKVLTTAKEKLQVSKNIDTSTSKETKKKKPVTKKTSEKKATTKKTTRKKPPAKKTATLKKESTEKKTATKKAPSKKTTEAKNDVKTTATKKPVAKKSSTKTVTTSKKPALKKKAKDTKKSPSAPRGAKKAEKIALYIKDIKKHYGEVDEDFVAIIVKNLGPAIYRKDAELVSCSDPKELDTVRRNFLIKKLGIDANKAVLDAAIEDVCTELKGVRTKYRATFYYALAKKFKKESVLS